MVVHTKGKRRVRSQVFSRHYNGRLTGAVGPTSIARVLVTPDLLKRHAERLARQKGKEEAEDEKDKDEDNDDKTDDSQWPTDSPFSLSTETRRDETITWAVFSTTSLMWFDPNDSDLPTTTLPGGAIPGIPLPPLRTTTAITTTASSEAQPTSSGQESSASSDVASIVSGGSSGGSLIPSATSPIAPADTLGGNEATTAASTDDPSDLSSSAIIGISAGIGGVTIASVFLIVFFLLRRHKRSAKAAAMAAGDNGNGDGIIGHREKKMGHENRATEGPSASGQAPVEAGNYGVYGPAELPDTGSYTRHHHAAPAVAGRYPGGHSAQQVFIAELPADVPLRR